MSDTLTMGKVIVIFERREDGGLRAWSDDVPGFVLSHSNPDAVLKDLKPALEVILSHIHGKPIHVEQLAETIPTQRAYAAFAAASPKQPLDYATNPHMTKNPNSAPR